MIRTLITTYFKLILVIMLTLSVSLSTRAGDNILNEPKTIIQNFIHDIRAGKNLNRIHDYMAPHLVAHQVWAEGGSAVSRTPESYREHIEEFQEAFGPFEVYIEEILADGDKVFVRWRQEGFHNVSLNGEEPTKMPLTEVTSTVYRLKDGKIIEYWLQTDRQGIDNQLTKIVSR